MWELHTEIITLLFDLFAISFSLPGRGRRFSCPLSFCDSARILGREDGFDELFDLGDISITRIFERGKLTVAKRRERKVVEPYLSASNADF